MVITVPSRPFATGRRRGIAALLISAAAMNAAMATASPISTILAADRLGDIWGGLPNTAGIVGTGIGALLLTGVTARRGWRLSLVGGYLAAMAGGVLAVYAVAGRDISLLSVGMLLLGIGNAGALLARYAAADHYPQGRRGFAIAVVVWAAAIGAVGGPLLLAPTGVLADWLGQAELSGPFLFAVVACAAAAVAMLAFSARRPSTGPAPAGASLRALAGSPAARPALAVMATAQVVMVAVMTAAPLDLHRQHHGLGSVGVVMAAHTLGMFALSPLTGRLLDRYGARPVMLTGLAVLAVSTAATAIASRSGVDRAALVLFLLGYGWNLCFIGGSGALAGGLPPAERLQVEGTVDAAVWGAAAAASLASTALLAAGGQALLGWVATALVAFPVVVVLRQRR